MELSISARHAKAANESAPALIKLRASEVEARLALERAYRSHYSDVYRYALVLTRLPAEAEEVASETFERAYLRSRNISEPALPRLLLIARRIATDRWRRARRWARVATGLRPTSGAAADETVVDFWLWFDAVSEVLTSRQREALLFRYQRDLTDADIAYVLGISESGVRSLIARALETLRSHPELL